MSLVQDYKTQIIELVESNIRYNKNMQEILKIPLDELRFILRQLVEEDILQTRRAITSDVADAREVFYYTTRELETLQ